MSDPVLALEYFDSAGTCALTYGGIDILHITINNNEADVQVFDRAAPDFNACAVAANVVVRLHPDVQRPAFTP